MDSDDFERINTRMKHYLEERAGQLVLSEAAKDLARLNEIDIEIRQIDQESKSLRDQLLHKEGNKWVPITKYLNLTSKFVRLLQENKEITGKWLRVEEEEKNPPKPQSDEFNDDGQELD